jgi:hypothetical protein
VESSGAKTPSKTDPHSNLPIRSILFIDYFCGFAAISCVQVHRQDFKWKKKVMVSKKTYTRGLHFIYSNALKQQPRIFRRTTYQD